MKQDVRRIWSISRLSCWYLALASVVLAAASVSEAAYPVDYDRQILPILSDNCYKCHGPDENARKAHLRLDRKEGAFRVREGKTVIAPGNADGSELIRRITSTDPDVKMPPPKSGRNLSAAQIELIKTWIGQGARWEMHWSLVAPTRPKAPEVADKQWCRNAIDGFVLAKLEQRHLKPASECAQGILLRRVTLDLTGLPPTPGELNAFLADKSPDAYEKVVDRLLASPRFGERMASIWLDLARFADTHGYQSDRYRPMWPYRDWVIKAFNENLPYDQFVTWQLAGDLLPGATKEQRLATAFNRLHMQNEEGGIIEEEYRVAYVVDRVDTFGTAFLGLTFECSRCHDHKFDPITQKDFYSLFAFFQNVDESGQTSYFTNPIAVPTMLLSDDATDRKLETLRRKIRAKEAELRSTRDGAGDAFGEWLEHHQGESPKITGEIAHFDFDEIKDGKIANLADGKKPGKAVERPTLVEGKFGKAAELSGENGFTVPGIGTFTRGDPFSLSIWLTTPTHEPRMTVIHHSKAPIDAGSRGYELLLEGGHVAFGLHHMWPGNSLKVVTKNVIPIKQWTQVVATYDGSSRAAGIRLYIDGKPAQFDVVRDGLYKDITYSVDGNGEPDLTIGYRFRDNGFKDGQVDEFRVFDRALTALEVSEVYQDASSTLPTGEVEGAPAPMQRDKLFDYFIATRYQPALTAAKELHELRKEENAITNSVPEIMVMQEMAHPKPAYILRRGAYDARGEEVFADTPAVLPKLAPTEPNNRLGLAHWLFQSDNPLTARVEVNRLWQQMFGRGLVETAENFGSQGSPPSHPELLDWLAVEFRERGWDVKHTLKLIAMSATYRQSSRAPRELLTDDPDNHLLARGPARRLTAEMLRDQALFDSGLLIEKFGGASVRPYQPPGVWDVAMGHPKYDQGHGDDLHRRSLYTFWKRSVPPPAMLAFDSPDRNYCVARRQSTSTPLQALALLNDVQITEAARFLSQRMIKEGGEDLDERVTWMFRVVTDREPSNAERAILKQILIEQREIFSTDTESARKLLAMGEVKNDSVLDPVELAAGTVLAEAILNHDEAVMRR
jgi:mono/diheme cytochrome c family protein